METRLFFVHALSPLHAGTGQAVGAIDLPIARERPTGIPLLPGSSVKGALRARCEDRSWRQAIFGPETENASDHAGAVHLSDVRLLLLPVRSAAGTFAWVTSPYLLQRFARDARAARCVPGATVTGPSATDRCTLARTSALAVHVEEHNKAPPKVVLEDLDFLADKETKGDAPVSALAAQLGRWLFPDGSDDAQAWQKSLAARLCVVHDDVMSLLLQTATEITARIRLHEEKKTVAQGGLWYEEALPVESILYGLAAASGTTDRGDRKAQTAAALLEKLADIATGMVQLGGKATVGRGACLVRFARVAP